MIKRILDILFIVISLPILLPVILFISFFLFWVSKNRIIFRQERMGFQGRTFMLYKFCSMNNKRDQNGYLLPDDLRLTRIGRFLRKTSMDELPSLWNVIKGEMSLVGPRPLLVEYSKLYSNEQFRRHEVMPGVTGWAQINGRNAITWEEKFKLDLWYLDNQSTWTDIKIIIMTIVNVLYQKDISFTGHSTMPKFTGKDE